ncbi:MAG: diguanylate cyclase [Planctomycetes bacterium]|nr:diguanylate cyclase [Planctomycetota bacterium]
MGSVERGMIDGMRAGLRVALRVSPRIVHAVPRRFRALTFSLFAGWIFWAAGPVQRIDTVWSDLLLVQQRMPASAEIVRVVITTRDLLDLGRDRLSRHALAHAIETLADSGAVRVLIDYPFGQDLLPDEESALRAAFGRLGKDRIAIGCDPDPVWHPPPSLMESATLVDLRLVADPDGRYRGLMQPANSALGNPALWLATGASRPARIPFDLRVDASSFPTFSLGQLTRGEIDPKTFADRRIVIALDRAVNKSRANLPVVGGVDRATLIAMGAHSQRTNYANRSRWADLLATVMGLAGIGVGFRIGIRSHHVKSAIWRFGLFAAVILAGSLIGAIRFGLRTEPTTDLILAMIGLYSAIVFRLGLAELLSGLFAGNMSPEEVLLWRIKAERPGPVVLFNAVGGVKRVNMSARAAFGIAEDRCERHAGPLARACMPQLGQRASRITWETPELHVWDVEWPHDHLPLAVFTDVTTMVEERAALHRRLITDPLTGALNRAGFEECLERLAASRQDAYAVLFMDMNGFKEVNDIHGHDAGDSLLKVAAGRFRSVLRKDTPLARLGGDEFAVVLEGPFPPETLVRLRSDLENALHDPIDVGSARVHVGVAVGFAASDASDQHPSDVVRRADAAMYARKAELKQSARSILPSFPGLSVR